MPLAMPRPQMPLSLRHTSVVSLFGLLFVLNSYRHYLEAIGKTYQKLINLLPKELQRFSLLDPEIKYGKYFHTRMGAKLCCLMFGVLIVLSIVMIFYYAVR